MAVATKAVVAICVVLVPAAAVGAAEEIGVRRSIRRHLIFQRGGDVLLPDDFGKAGGAILAIERAVGHETVPFFIRFRCVKFA